MFNKSFICSGILENITPHNWESEKGAGIVYNIEIIDGKRKYFLSTFDKNFQETYEKIKVKSFVFCSGEIRNKKNKDGVWVDSYFLKNIEVISESTADENLSLFKTEINENASIENANFPNAPEVPF